MLASPQGPLILVGCHHLCGHHSELGHYCSGLGLLSQNPARLPPCSKRSWSPHICMVLPHFPSAQPPIPSAPPLSLAQALLSPGLADAPLPLASPWDTGSSQICTSPSWASWTSLTPPTCCCRPCPAATLLACQGRDRAGPMRPQQESFTICHPHYSSKASWEFTGCTAGP